MKHLLATLLVFSALNAFAASKEKDSSDEGDAMSKCLRAWGNHPFRRDPKFRTMSTSVKVFGIGKNPRDAEVTTVPALIMINPAVNVMGGTEFELLNPNGWYCFKANVNVMGGFIIKAHCDAHIASANTGATVLGSSETDDGNAVTVMGSTKVELVDCKKK